MIAASARASEKYTELSLGYSTGDYGTSVETQISRFTFSAGILSGRQQFNISIPYLALNDSESDSVNGVGDTIIHYGYTTKKSKHNYSIYSSLSVKIPTADETKGLGSGETDIGAFASVNKHWRNTIAGLGAGYIVVGEPKGEDLNNIAQASVSVYRQFQRTYLGGYLDYHSAYSDAAGNTLEGGINVYYILNRNKGITANVFKGLNGNSADYGLQLGWIIWF